ncbi:putative PEP-binding protein [Caulobacter segnis]
MVSEGDLVVVDAETQEAWLRPRPDVVKALKVRMEVRAQRKAEFARLRDTPPITKDGAKITLLMNAGLAARPRHPGRDGAEGIGLFPAPEFQFMVAEELPRLEAQTALYEKVLEAADGMPVTFRTPGPRRRQAAAVAWSWSARTIRPWGWRAVRMGLDRSGPAAHADPRRLIKAAGGRPLRVMFLLGSPIVDEFRARPLVPSIRKSPGPEARSPRASPTRCRRRWLRPPSLLWHLDALLPMTDFVSARHQRPDAVPVRRRPGQSEGVGPLRPAVAGRPAGSQDHPAGLRRHRYAGVRVRRDGRLVRWRPSPWSPWDLKDLACRRPASVRLKQMVLEL